MRFPGIEGLRSPRVREIEYALTHGADTSPEKPMQELALYPRQPNDSFDSKLQQAIDIGTPFPLGAHLPNWIGDESSGIPENLPPIQPTVVFDANLQTE